MITCLRKCSKESQFCSGVHLDYTLEETLESFIMEKRLTSKTKLVQEDVTDTNNKGVKAAKLLECHQNVQSINQQDNSDKFTEQMKRPFLRKNQGRGAWCSRLRPLGGKAAPEPASNPPLVSTVNQTHNPTNCEAFQRKYDCQNSEECSGQSMECSAFIAKLDALNGFNGKVYDQTGLQNDIKEGLVVNEDAKADFVGDDRELKEFEFLERFTEKHTYVHNNSELERNHLGGRSSGTVDVTASVGKSASLPALDEDNLPRNSRQLADGDKSKEATHRFICNLHANHMDSECPKRPHCKSYQSLSQNPLVKNAHPAIESSSPDLDDHVPWKDEANFEASVDTNSSRRQPLPSVRFNMPTDCHRPKLGDKNSFNGGSNSGSDVFDRPSPSTIQIWIARLEAEVNRFNSENTALVKLKAEREEALSALKKEKKEFEEYRATTMKEFETFRREEIIKLKKDRKVLCDYQRSLHSMPQKRDREEIERLKQQICEEKAEAAQREIRLQHQLGWQKIRIEELTAEKTELVERIKRLEQARLMLRSTVVEERANQALKTLNQFHKNVIGISSHAKTLEDSLNGEMAKARADSAGTNSERLVAMPSEPSPSRSTGAYLAKGAMKESPRSPSACVFPHPPTSIATGLSQQGARTSSDILEFCREDTNTNQLCRPLRAAPDRNRGPVIHEVYHPDGSLERLYRDSSRARVYGNGTTKEICPDGVLSEVCPSNSDAKQTLEDGTILYNYASDGAVKSTLPDGAKEIVYKDPAHYRTVATQSVVVGESNLPDGMSVQIFLNGDKIISLPNGQKEFHCAKFKRRIYPDGTVKTVFKDGRQETRYASGRIRIKDNEGNLLVDTRIAPVSRSAVADLAPLLGPSQ
ncbi:Centromere protein J [Echinococcus granulosus]|uniref:Centromere protein j n=1 Tax=Echinococcus granulosus TaxID=6210 RepID=A0A068WB07_ECHGR|nr:Centromere protein J [Echinococcus granulosus]CDS15601.1 centromere protein j [Echinococcus granulosus]